MFGSAISEIYMCDFVQIYESITEFPRHQCKLLLYACASREHTNKPIYGQVCSVVVIFVEAAIRWRFFMLSRLVDMQLVINFLSNSVHNLYAKYVSIRDKNIYFMGFIFINQLINGAKKKLSKFDHLVISCNQFSEINAEQKKETATDNSFEFNTQRSRSHAYTSLCTVSHTSQPIHWRKCMKRNDSKITSI